jgi:hypothetical protein
LDFGKISEKQWKDWNDKVKYESFEKKVINGLGFFSRWTGLKFVKIGKKKKRLSLGFRKNQGKAVKWWGEKYESFEKKKISVNGLGFFSRWTGLKGEMINSLWNPEFGFFRATGGPQGKIQKCRRREGRWPPLPAPYTSEFFPGGPHVKKFGRNFCKKKNQVSYRSIPIWMNECK